MPTEEQCSDAVQALYRIRAVEKPPGGDGRREIWHQGSKGAELLSTVDAAGKLEDQEFTLFREAISWRRGDGLRTGKFISDEDVASRSNVMWDDAASPVRLSRTKKALASYKGKDAYLIHLRDVIEAALAGMDFDDNRAITSPYPSYLPGDSQAVQMPVSPVKRVMGRIKKMLKRRPGRK
jgi:hypothetical protein